MNYWATQQTTKFTDGVEVRVGGVCITPECEDYLKTMEQADFKTDGTVSVGGAQGRWLLILRDHRGISLRVHPGLLADVARLDRKVSRLRHLYRSGRKERWAKKVRELTERFKGSQKEVQLPYSGETLDVEILVVNEHGVHLTWKTLRTKGEPLEALASVFPSAGIPKEDLAWATSARGLMLREAASDDLVVFLEKLEFLLLQERLRADFERRKSEGQVKPPELARVRLNGRVSWWRAEHRPWLHERGQQPRWECGEWTLLSQEPEIVELEL